MDLHLSDKTVLVTGASGGIGRALTEAFAAEGARLVLLAHRGRDALTAWVDAQPWRDRALVRGADVAAPDDLDAAVTAGLDAFGRIDVAIVNAGVWPADDRPLHELPIARVREVVEVDLLGALWTARSFLAGLARTGPRPDGHGAALVFVGSTAGRFGERGHVEYAAAKAALRGVVLSLKNEIVDLDPAGRVNLVEPGWTLTPLAAQAIDAGTVARALRTMPLARLATADDVARAVVFMASHAARHVTGEFLTVAGGMEGRVQRDEPTIDLEAVLRRTRG